MKKSDVQPYKNKLLEMRDRLRIEIDRMAETVLSDVRAPGEHDRTASEAVDKELALENTEEEIRRQVVAALERIDEGTYGECQQCRTSISPARLDAVPFTPYCIDCEREFESR